MNCDVIKKTSLNGAIALAALAALSACDDTSKSPVKKSSSTPMLSNGVNVRQTIVTEPLLRAAGEGKDYEWGKDHIFIKLSKAETNGMLTLIQDNLKPGFNLGMHFHRAHTEIFYILDGEVEFETDKTSFTAKTGSVVYLPAGITHAAKSSMGGKMLMFYAPGGFDEMLAEIEKASWLQRINPFAKARRNKKFDFNEGTDSVPVVANPLFIANGEGSNSSLPAGNASVKLSTTDTEGLAKVTEETLKPGFERISTIARDQFEVLYILDGQIEIDAADSSQIASKGATLYLPVGFQVKITSSSGAKLLSYATSGAQLN